MRAAVGDSVFQCGDIAISLFPPEELAGDAGIADDGTGFSGFSIAHNVRERSQVDEVFAEATAAGATVVKPATDAPWGGYAGYFRDLDGHLWEVARNPGFPLADDGSVTLPR